MPTKHYGKHIVTAGLNHNEILAYGNDPGKLVDQARKQGHKEPLIIFIPDPNITYMY